MVTSKRGAYPHTDAGVEVRRIFHKLRSLANENFNEHFKSIFEVHEQVPTKGRVSTARFALGGGVGLPVGSAATVMGESQRSTVDSNHFSELLDEL